MNARPGFFVSAAVAIAIGSSGCVRRTISITSSPDGALVFLNQQEVGRTPLEVEFVYYGEYDVRLIHPDREPLVTHAKASPPLWDNIPFDLLAEAVPGEPHVQIHWHYDLNAKDDQPDDVLARARATREQLGPPPEIDSPESEANADSAATEETPPKDESPE